MTWEEAIKRISRWLHKGKQHSDYQLGYIEGWFTKEDEEAFLMAIEALQKEPKIIRCCQCKYAKVADSEDSQDGYTCQFHRGSIWFSGSYCSWAERSETDAGCD